MRFMARLCRFQFAICVVARLCFFSARKHSGFWFLHRYDLLAAFWRLFCLTAEREAVKSRAAPDRPTNRFTTDHPRIAEVDCIAGTDRTTKFGFTKENLSWQIT
jgi:hypothetical protein